jgi:putative transposase
MSPYSQGYATDLTDAQWELIRRMTVLPTGGRPRTTNLRSIVNATLYQAKTACPWYLLPRDFFPPEGTFGIIFTYSNEPSY